MHLKSYAKINLSLDILGLRPDGYHNISSLMQNIGLYDELEVEKCSKNGTKYNFTHCSICKLDVYLCSGNETIPAGSDNLAVKGAKSVIEALEKNQISHDLKEIWIRIDKKLPIAAGIAGGSGNAAVTMLAINALAGYPFALRELMDMGAKVGADVPYSLLMNAKMNADELASLRGIEEASVAAMMTGIGDVVEAASPIHKYVILANPGISVSTKEAYEEIDKLQDRITEAGLFTNQLEKYTLANYPEAKDLRDAMQENLDAELVLMSGSGPTMVAYYDDAETAKQDYDKMLREDWFKENWRAWLTETGF